MALKSTGTEADQVAAGTTGKRPDPSTEGLLRLNQTTGLLEYSTGTEWKSAAGISGKNGQINIEVGGSPLIISGPNATANQSGSTTRTISFDKAWGIDRWGAIGSCPEAPQAGRVKAALVQSVYQTVPTILASRNVAMISTLQSNVYQVHFTTPLKNVPSVSYSNTDLQNSGNRINILTGRDHLPTGLDITGFIYGGGQYQSYTTFACTI